MGQAREIFVAVCSEIATALAHHGFEYRQSKQTLVKRDGDLTLEIHFQSSHSNYLVADEVRATAAVSGSVPSSSHLTSWGSVTLIVHVSVRSRAIKAWRRSLSQPLRTDDAVSGGQIGNLQRTPEWIEFNLANPNHRQTIIKKAAELIEDIALPYFDRFRNPSEVIVALIAGTLPWFWEPAAVEYACCFGTIDQARRMLETYLDKFPEAKAEYHHRLQDYSLTGIPDSSDSSLSGRLAKAAILLGIDRSAVERPSREN